MRKNYFTIKCLNIVFLFLLVNNISAQEKAISKDYYAHYVIKDHWVQSQKFADSLNALNEYDKSNFGNDPNPPPPPPPIAIFDLTSYIHFSITPSSYIYYKIPDQLENYPSRIEEIRWLEKINRDKMTRIAFDPNHFEEYGPYEITYADEVYYKILQVNKHIKRKIADFDCYQVLLKQHSRRYIEIFVTEDLILDFHPVLNLKTVLKKYYPLYIKYYDPKYPNDSFREYKIIKFR